MTIEKVSSKKNCEICALQGIKSTFHLFQINDTEAYLMCRNVNCSYFSYDVESSVVKRDLSKLSIKAKDNSSSASSVVSFCSSTLSRSGIRTPVRTKPSSTGSSDSEDNLLKPIKTFSNRSVTPVSEVKERKFLVPFAPFLTQHENNFYSFQSNTLERVKKRQLITAQEEEVKRSRINRSPVDDIEKINLFSTQGIIPKKDFEPPKNKRKQNNNSCEDFKKITNGLIKLKSIPNELSFSSENLFSESDQEFGNKNVFDITPVGLLQDFLKDHSGENNSLATTSSKSIVANINELLSTNVSSNKLSLLNGSIINEQVNNTKSCYKYEKNLSILQAPEDTAEFQLEDANGPRKISTMPITGNLNQENQSLDNPEQQIEPLDNIDATEVIQTPDCVGSEVSSTTVDPDPTVLTGDEGSISEAVQSTSLDIASDSLDGLKDSKESAASVTNNVTNPQYSKGFQDAFAAFASSSFREEDELPIDMNEELNTKGDSVVSAAADSASSEPVVSSAIDSGLVSTTDEESLVKSDSEMTFVSSDETAVEQTVVDQIATFPETAAQSFDTTQQPQVSETGTESTAESTTATDSVYFIQTTDASGQVVTSIIDPNDIPSYTDSVVYKQCMLPNGEIETTIVSQGGIPMTQEEQSQEQIMAAQESGEQVEPNIIYIHDENGQLTPIDSAQSANDVAPPGKQFVFMQDSTGRVIRTIMDANQTMVPGQHVFYTQSEDGRIITSVMDSATAGVEDSGQQPTADQLYLQQTEQGYQAQEAQQQLDGSNTMVGASSSFNIDNSMSGLSMLAELSHLTAGQATESRTASSTESNSMDTDEFRPVAMFTRRVGEEGDAINADLGGLKVGEAEINSLDQDQGSSLSQEDFSGQEDSVVSKLLAEMKIDFNNPSYSVSRDNLFVQWQNLDAMCWMDVVLIMLVYSPTLRPLVNLDSNHELATTLLITLLKANRQAQVLLQNLLKKSNGAEISGLQTGAGNTASLQDPKTSKLVCKENMDEIGKAINILYAMREKIWQALQPRLRCERGKHNSPVLVLPLLVREKPAIKQMFTMNYRYVFKCEVCGYSQDDAHTKILPSIPAVPSDFNMSTPSFVRNCFECQAPNQRMLMKFEGLQDFVQMHFVKGLPHSRFDELSFDFNEDHYEVTAVIHYKNNPDHFIAWVRNAPGPTWMECDDLKSVITRYQHQSPNIPPSQVHMVMWERRLTQQHTLIMRDTEDTKLLASLVLTVQQPSSQQSADTASRPANASSSHTPMYSTLQSNSLLPGVGTQLLSNTSTPRGRGRGRGSRGSYGSRGRGSAATTIMPIRRTTPSITQLVSQASSGSMQSRTPQTIRVPISSLQGSIRGTNLGGEKIVFLSNNSGTTSTPGTGSASKVVVVRSQGGASNISAAQILQLLQRSGALTGGRIATSSNASQSYIMQQDGSIVSTSSPAEPETTNQHVPVESTEISNTAVTEQPVETFSETTMESEKSGQTGDEIHQEVTQTENQISTLSFSAATPVREQPASCETIILSPESASSSQTAVETDQASNVKTILSQAQQPTRYIQIPNQSGSGTILTQLTMKGGKMVLIPVDKNTQAQLSGTSILKLNNPGSPKIAIRAVNPQPLTGTSAGALLSHLQQQSSQTVTTIGGQKHLTIPAQKKTIQVITLPGSQSGQGITKKLVSTLSGPALPQSGNIVIRDLNKDSDSVNALPAPVVSSSQLISTPAVSLLKDVSARGGTSLLNSLASQQQKNQESFRYILQGSSTTHVLQAGASVTNSSVGRAFTALSSSGTIIGGQLTPSNTSAIGTSPMDQDVSLPDTEDTISVLNPARRISQGIDTSEYTPLGRGRAKTRGQRGRGRGGRTPRGRGRAQLWSADTDYIPPAQMSSNRKISTLPADLRQIGAHVIESSAEAVDGVPVVSIPDFSTEDPNHLNVPDSVPGTLQHVHSDNTVEAMSAISELTSASQELQEAQLTGAVLSPQGPRVITQSIPSFKANHGFDILTQGILGSAVSQSAMPKQARSLLTGSPVILPAASESMSGTTTILDASEMISAVSRQQTSVQSEIDTLIEAAQAAAKPVHPTLSKSPISALPLIRSPEKRESNFPESTTLDMSHAEMEMSQAGIETNQANVETNQTEIDLNQMEERPVENIHQTCDTEVRMEEELVESEERVVSVDESQVSTAERYRMPMELFQEDDESPEKPVRSFIPDVDSEVSSQEEDWPTSPKGAARHKTVEEIELSKKAAMLDSSPPTSKFAYKGTKKKLQLSGDSFSDDYDISGQIKQIPEVKPLPPTTGKKRGRKKKIVNDISSFAHSPMQNNFANREKEVQLSNVKPKSTNIGGFATDLLRETEDESVPVDNQIADNVESKCDTDICVLSPAAEKIIQTNEESICKETIASDSHIKEVAPDTDKEVKEKVLTFPSVRKRVIGPPAFVPLKKFKVDWDVDEDKLCKIFNHPRPFNYKVLQGKLKTPPHRHPSLARLQDMYTSPPSPIYHVFKEKPVVHWPPIVIRRIPKALQKPVVDPSKEPTVIPLVAEDESDPFYTGGSVVTSPIDGEIFNGVVLKKKVEPADWISSLEDSDCEEEPSEAQQFDRLDYCNALLTEFYIAAVSSGDYTYLESCESCEETDDKPMESPGHENVADDNISDHVPTQEEDISDVQDITQVDTTISSLHFEQETVQSDNIVSTQPVQENLTFPSLSSSDISSPITSSPTLNTDSVLKKRRGRPKKDTFAKLSAIVLEMSPARETSETSNIKKQNGMDSVCSPDVFSMGDSSVAQKDLAASHGTFPSPSRRSGRTPVPSKRMRDALEDIPSRPSVKVRRTSVVSSDDEHSASAGESAVKKMKKQVPIPS